MLNPNHLLKLQQALHLIMGPHSDYKNRTLTSLIKEGEQILSELRTHAFYAYLLSNYLIQLSKSSKFSSEVRTRSKLFVLLELKKIVPLTTQNIWWDLLEFYYSCEERAEILLTQLIVTHFSMKEDYLSNVYRQFFPPRHDWARGGMFRVAKAVTLAFAIIAELQQPSLGKKQAQQQIGHVQYMAEFLQELLSQTINIMPNYCQAIAVSILKLLMVGHQAAGNGTDTGEYNFRQKNLIMISNTLSSQRSLPSVLHLLVFACSAGLNNSQLRNKNGGWEIGRVLKELLRERRKNNKHVQQLKILNYFLTSFQENRRILRDCQDEILGVYEEYITQVEVKQPVHIVLPNFPKEDTGFDSPSGDNLESSSYSLKFHILNFCITPQLLRTRLNRSEVSLLPLLAYCAQPLPPQIHTHTVKIVLAYIKSLVHHPGSENLPIIFCCLRYLYLYIIEDPNYGLLDICTAIINLRFSSRETQHLCDMVLCKGAETISTTAWGSEIWEFVIIWRDSLMQNYMEVSAVSFYPVLLILEGAEDHYFADFSNPEVHSFNFPAFYEQILESLIDENRSIKSSPTNHGDTAWCDNFQVFYKWCTVYIKYLTANRIFHLQQGVQTLNLADLKNQKITATIDKAIGHIFRNELYCADTAYLYTMKLIVQGPKEGVLDFVNNLMTEAFWRGLDQCEVFFYCCVLMGIVRGFSELFPPAELYPNYIAILRKVLTEFSEHSLNRMRSELTVFLSHFELQSNQHELLLFQQLAAHVGQKSMFCQQQQIY